MSTNVDRLEEILKQLTPIQLRYVEVRPFYKFDYEAADDIKVSKDTVSRWNEKEIIDEAVKLVMADGIILTKEILRRKSPKAARVMAELLEHRSEMVRFKASKDILDRNVGNAPEKVEHSGSIEHKVTVNWDDDNLPD